MNTASPSNQPDPTSILREVFGYDQFRGDQLAVVDWVTQGGDALVLMPTGAGKSLCYQIPAIARQRQGRGTTVVVSPLIALMHDQVGALHELGVAAAHLNSTLSLEAAQATEQALLRGEITLLYAAPERVTHPRFLALMDTLHAQDRLSMFAIDEAHCVSQWGHDFRPEYRALCILHERYSRVPRIALTATADALTRSDILERLELGSARCFISSFDRPNIRYTIVEKRSPMEQLLRFIRTQHAGDCGIVYCQSRRKVDETALALRDAGIPALAYHAGLDVGTRQRHQDHFLRSEGQVMVATIAFGMGIDKPDVRFVAHLDMPKNIEGYYQETGRAGRDGLAADAWMAYGMQDVVNQRRMIDESPAPDAFKAILRGKLDALLALAEDTQCRRVRLLGYFGEASTDCGNCDNCLTQPAVWDGTEAARMLLSTIYRIQQHSEMAFGAGHVMDVLRGKATDKVHQYGHATLSTYGVGANFGENQLRGVLRQLLARGALSVDTDGYNTLHLTALSRQVLRGEVPVLLRDSSSAVSGTSRRKSRGASAVLKAPMALDADALVRYAALKAWRSEVAKAHNLPAYVIFHDSTLATIAKRNPQDLEDLRDVSGLGSKKFEAYAAEVLGVLGRQL